MELWRDIPDFEGLYQASANGEIRSLDHIRKNGTNEYKQKGKILKFNKNPNGYLQVRLSKNGVAKTYRVNRLIALTFIENPLNKETINHINGNKLDNRVENLEWATHKEQTKHMHEVLGVPYADCSNLVKKGDGIMELWVRSQDKDKLVLAKGFETQHTNYDGGCQIFAVWQNNYQMVGKYKNNKRAVEVLDEIQELINPKQIITTYENEIKECINKTTFDVVMTPKIDNIELIEPTTLVYEMPVE